MYVIGYTNSGDFPAIDSTYNGGPNDAFVTKLRATGSSLVYSAYLGGAGDDNGDVRTLFRLCSSFISRTLPSIHSGMHM